MYTQIKIRIESFHVTSYQANFGSHQIRYRHIGFLFAPPGIAKSYPPYQYGDVCKEHFSILFLLYESTSKYFQTTESIITPAKHFLLEKSYYKTNYQNHYKNTISLFELRKLKLRLVEVFQKSQI